MSGGNNRAVPVGERELAPKSGGLQDQIPVKRLKGKATGDFKEDIDLFFSDPKLGFPQGGRNEFLEDLGGETGKKAGEKFAGTGSFRHIRRITRVGVEKDIAVKKSQFKHDGREVLPDQRSPPDPFADGFSS